MDNLKFNKVILHILDVNHEAPILSVQELSLEKDITDFLDKHISKVLNQGDLKKAYFNENNSEVFKLCSELSQNEELFVPTTSQLAQRLFFIMKQNPSIPSGDLIIAIFEIGENKYFSLIKLNYRSSYIHYVSPSNEGNVNRLIKQQTTLPSETQKIDECAIINLTNFELQILEKQYEICGDKEYYLSKYFLGCSSDLSYLQKMKILDSSVSKISKKYYDGDFEKVTVLRGCLAESIEESNQIEVDMVAEVVFGENNEIKNAYVSEVKKAGLADNIINVPEISNPGKKFKSQKLKTDSGIEINFPAHLYNNRDVMEFINNPDGTISIIIKNVNKVVNK